jgi:hypothetical protein
MTPHNNDLEKFSRLIEALRPWLGQIIFIGGRARRLYWERPIAFAPSSNVMLVQASGFLHRKAGNLLASERRSLCLRVKTLETS